METHTLKPIDDHNPYMQMPLWKRAAKVVLTVLHKILPRRAYEAIYFPCYEAYRQSLLRSYARKLRAAKASGNAANIARCQRVYSVMPYSLIGESGLEHTHDRAADVIERGVKGAFLECGVAGGGCAALIAKVASSTNPGRACWFFDSYEGLPDPTNEDFEDGKTGAHIRPLPRGSCLGTYEQVSDLLFNTMQLPKDRIHLVKGWFQDTLPVTAAKIGPIALLRIDGDWYDSTMCCLENLFDQVSPGGCIIIDDYFSCYGARKATNEFLERNQVNCELVSDGRGGCSFIKPVGARRINPVSAEVA